MSAGQGTLPSPEMEIVPDLKTFHSASGSRVHLAVKPASLTWDRRQLTRFHSFGERIYRGNQIERLVREIRVSERVTGYPSVYG